MLFLVVAFTAIYALLLFAECTALARGRHGVAWALLRLPAATLALVPLLALAMPKPAPQAAPAALEEPSPKMARALALSPAEPGGAPPASGGAEPGIHWLIHYFSDLHGVDPLLVLAMIQEESNFDPKAVSPRGAMGLMQINKITAKELGLENPFDVRENLDGGIRYLQMLLQRHRWDLALALASYNAGPTTVERYKGIPPYRETRRYVWRVIRRYKRLRRMDEVFRQPPKPTANALRHVLASTGREEASGERARTSVNTF